MFNPTNKDQTVILNPGFQEKAQTLFCSSYGSANHGLPQKYLIRSLFARMGEYKGCESEDCLGSF